jgi:hypothetical protein
MLPTMHSDNGTHIPSQISPNANIPELPFHTPAGGK